MRTDITLYCDGDGVSKNSHTILYKNIKDFTVNANHTVTFKTQKFGKITTPLLWRLSEELPNETAADEAPAGNQGRVRARW
jgi:hypothetical protein